MTSTDTWGRGSKIGDFLISIYPNSPLSIKVLQYPCGTHYANGYRIKAEKHTTGSKLNDIHLFSWRVRRWYTFTTSTVNPVGRTSVKATAAIISASGVCLELPSAHVPTDSSSAKMTLPARWLVGLQEDCPVICQITLYRALPLDYRVNFPSLRGTNLLGGEGSSQATSSSFLGADSSSHGLVIGGTFGGLIILSVCVVTIF